MEKKNLPKNFICDVDGVLNTGQFLYDETGKKYKIFGPDDSEGLKILKKYLKIQFITSDLRGFPISKKRVTDMGFKIKYVRNNERYKWIKENFNLKESIFMGDSLSDLKILKETYISICPKNSIENIKKYVTYTTKRNGGDRAVAEACLFILSKVFKKNIEKLLTE